MREGETIIFVEVRSRHNQHYASALESIDASKIKKIARAAACYLQQRQWTYTRLARFDVVALERQQIHWIKDAFQLDTF